MARRSKAKKKTVLLVVRHMIPAIDLEADDAPGWLLHLDPKPRGVHGALDRAPALEDRVLWDRDVKSYWFDHDAIEPAKVVVESALPGTWCPDCLSGHPCDVWPPLDINEYGFDARHPEQLDPDDPRYDSFNPWLAKDDPEAVAGAEFRNRFREAMGQAAQNIYTRVQHTTWGEWVAAFLTVPLVTGPTLATHAAVLGVPWPTTPDEVRAAFKRKVMAAHPDRGGSAAETQRVVAARDALMSALGS